MAVLNDPNSASNIMAVKAASTAAVAADMAAVVALSPNSLLPGNNRPDNYYRVAMDPTSLLFDTFDSGIDTTDRWTTFGTVVPTAANGTLTVNAGTVASAWSALQSKTTFPLLGNMFSQLVSVIKTNATLTTGNYRFVGFGTLPGTPTAALPITDGVGVEWIDSTGDMALVVWSAGVRTLSLSLTASRPSDGAFHRPAIYYKTSRVYIELDNVSLGSIATPNPNSSNLPMLILSVNGLSALGAGATLQSSFLGVGDSARNNLEISDGAFPWRKLTVKAPSTAPAAADLAAVVALSPNAPIGTKTNNAAAPGATNVGVLPMLANAAAPAWTEGNLALGSVDLSGAQRVTARPIASGTLGHYRFSVVTGTLAAALAAGAVVFSARWGDATRFAALLRFRLRFMPLAPFTAATLSDHTSFDAVVGRTFSASHTGGTGLTLTGNSFKMRASMGSTLFTDLRIATTAALAGGTVTLDPHPLASTLRKGNRVNVAAGTEEVIESSNNALDIDFSTGDGQHPLILATNEGLVVRNRTVWPAAGTGILQVEMVWAEVAAY